MELLQMLTLRNPMGWVFTLCLMFVCSAPSFLVYGRTVDTCDFPFCIKPHIYAEQSPTNVITRNAEKLELPPLVCHFLQPFDKAKAVLTNIGHTISVRLAEDTDDVPHVTGGPLFKQIYDFEELHMHWGKHNCGSEHLLNFKRYAMEVHMVHYKREYGSFEKAKKYLDGVCVVGVFLKISQEDNPEMNNFIRDLDNLHEFNSSMVRNFKTEFDWIDDIALKQHSYYAYHGSLTTTPFAECVIWILFTYPIPISENQLKEFRELHTETGKLIKTNDRDLQPFNNRHVIYVD